MRDEAIGLLQTLIRLNTVNPPGNETVAAEALRDYLAAQGVECELFARAPERANLVARIAGGDGPSLAFLSHTDTAVRRRSPVVVLRRASCVPRRRPRNFME